MKQPTRQQIQEAKDYIKLRLRAEISMQDNLEKALLQAANEIVGISMRYGIKPSFSASLPIRS